MPDIARERRLLADQGLALIARETWGATTDYTTPRDVVEPAEGFVLHISVTVDHGDLTGHEHGDMRTIERIGQERFGATVGFPYNAAVFDTGRIYEGQPLTRRGAHTVNTRDVDGYVQSSSGSMNPWYRAIVLPQMVSDDVTDAQVDGCARWAAAQVRSGLARRGAVWLGHRDVAFKSCPGDTGYALLGEIRRRTDRYIEEDDMPSLDEIGDEVDRRLASFAGRRWASKEKVPAALTLSEMLGRYNSVGYPQIVRELAALKAQNVALVEAFSQLAAGGTVVDYEAIGRLVETAVRAVFADAATPD